MKRGIQGEKSAHAQTHDEYPAVLSLSRYLHHIVYVIAKATPSRRIDRFAFAQAMPRQIERVNPPAGIH